MSNLLRTNTACLIATTMMLLTVTTGNSLATDFRYGKSIKSNELSQNGRMVSKKQFESGISRQILKLKRSGIGKNAGFNFTSINVVDDCSASITCGDGTVIQCSVQGPGTCESGMVSVACITSTSSEHSSCPAG